MNLILASLFAFGILLCFVGVALFPTKPTRVDQVVGQYSAPRKLDDVELSQPFTQRVIKPILRAIARIFGRLTPQYIMESTRHKLDLAGNPYNLPPIEFLGVRGLVTVLTATLATLAFSFLQANLGLVILSVLMSAAIGFYLPVFWIEFKIHARQNEIAMMLPDALDLLTICVEAGLGFDGAVGRVAARWNNELGRAFGRVLFNIRVGMSRHEALRDMAKKVEVPDLTSFIAAIIQSEQLGAPIAKVLRVQSDQMRIIRRQRAQEQANQIPVRVLFPLVFLIFPAMFVVILGPALLRMMVSGFLK